ncbi:uncharacterized protein LOC106011739 [Aplysia californica]|uniref:Uncharacterized protein LOC106011739 n=1 Tax=Aplysia californica TaxID=6500 RepID=A0ABM0ZZN9_APLCA|nr:uncharacterized protein LOC106011739 [Aplysia californica]
MAIFGYITVALAALAVTGRVYCEVTTPKIIVESRLHSDTETEKTDQNIDVAEQPAATLTGEAYAQSSAAYFSRQRPNQYDADGSCWIGNRLVRHGQVVSLTHQNPCWKVICWYGRPHEEEDGCHLDGQCHPLNQDFQMDCRTMRCSKRQLGTNSWRYHVTTVATECRDARGICRRVGERNFSAVIDRQTYHDCECQHGGRMYCMQTYPF